MRLWSTLIFCSALCTTQLSCSVNILENFADKNSDEARFEDAKKLMNDGEYNAAIDKIAEMGTAYQNLRKVKALSASAYGGRCGLQFLDFVDALGNMGTTRLFSLLSSTYAVATPAKYADCLTAENILESIGTVTQRTNDENMLMVLISFSKIGNILSFYTDADDNGTPDAAFTAAACNTSGSQTANGALTEADQREVGTGLTIAIQSISQIASSVNLGNASLASVSSACSTLATLDPTLDFCTITDPTGFSAQHLRAIRSLIREDSAIGVGSCAGDVTTCLCP